MKRIMWTDRTPGTPPESADDLIRNQISLPVGLPRAGWKRDNGAVVEISSERFPGSSPVWIWEE